MLPMQPANEAATARLDTPSSPFRKRVLATPLPTGFARRLDLPRAAKEMLERDEKEKLLLTISLVPFDSLFKLFRRNFWNFVQRQIRSHSTLNFLGYPDHRLVIHGLPQSD